MKKITLIFFFAVAISGGTQTVNAQGAFQKYYTNQGSPILINDIKVCSDGGFITATDNKLIKLNSAGDVVWAKELSLNCSSCSGDFYIHSVGEINGSGYFALGENYSPANRIFSLIKTDVNGSIDWVKIFDSNSQSPPYDISKLTFLPAGGFLLTVSLVEKVLLVKADAAGDLVWSKSFQGDTVKCPGFQSVVLANGDIMTCYKDNTDVGIVLTNASGVLLWSKRFGNNGDLYNRPYSMTQSPDGNILIAGLQNVPSSGYPVKGFLMKTDINGNVLWNKIYSSSDINGISFGDVKQLPNSDVLMSGNSWYDGSNFIVKTDSSGNLIFSKVFGTTTLGIPSFTYFKSDVIDNNNIIVAGQAFAFKNDVQGDFPCNDFDFPLTVAPNTAFLTNNVSTSITEGIGAFQITGTATLTAANIVSGDYCSIIGIDENSSAPENGITIYPNPSSGTFTIQSINQQLNNSTITISNMLGEKVYGQSRLIA
ncbi:MAG TPA: T9SS type A sorting domain-containing protein [Bacteroidia bacterium]|nr:T9SS type A sorting domain-containing protein [Bacteroidia bacterium]